MAWCPFKKFSDIFGKPNTGAHSYRLFNIAIIDLFFTIVGAFMISYFFNVSFILIFILLMLIAILLHRLFCVNTTINKFIFGVV
jgi:fatty-acid desaturase